MASIATIVSWFIEGDEGANTIPPAIILNKLPNEVTIGDIKRYYHGPRGVFLFKTVDEDYSQMHDSNSDERFHWTVAAQDNDNTPVPLYGQGIIMKVRPIYESLKLVGEKRRFSGETDLSYGSPKSRKSETLYPCTYQGCDKTFNKPWRLKSHLRNHTGEKKPHTCHFPDCDRSFNESQALKNHLRVHSGEKPFVCPSDSCGKRFSEKGNLRKHMRIHTGEKPYVCTYEDCDKAFGRSDQLKVHIYDHTGIKPFQCDYEGCGKTFSYSSGLKVHQRVHTDQVPRP